MNPSPKSPVTPDARLLGRLARAQAELDKAADALAAASRTRTRQVRAALSAGHSYGAVAKALGVGRAAVQSIAGPVVEWRGLDAPRPRGVNHGAVKEAAVVPASSASTQDTLPPVAEAKRCVRHGCDALATRGRLCPRHHGT